MISKSLMLFSMNLQRDFYVLINPLYQLLTEVMINGYFLKMLLLFDLMITSFDRHWLK